MQRQAVGEPVEDVGERAHMGGVGERVEMHMADAPPPAVGGEVGGRRRRAAAATRASRPSSRRAPRRSRAPPRPAPAGRRASRRRPAAERRSASAPAPPGRRRAGRPRPAAGGSSRAPPPRPPPPSRRSRARRRRASARGTRARSSRSAWGLRVAATVAKPLRRRCGAVNRARGPGARAVRENPKEVWKTGLRRDRSPPVPMTMRTRMPDPRAYVLISPCRDEAAHMRRTLDSVVAQTVRPAQWVIVDDGSTDATPRDPRRVRRPPRLDRGGRETRPGRARRRPRRDRGVLRRARAGRTSGGLRLSLQARPRPRPAPRLLRGADRADGGQPAHRHLLGQALHALRRAASSRRSAATRCRSA